MELSIVVKHNVSTLSKLIVEYVIKIWLIKRYVNKQTAKNECKGLQKNSSLFKCCPLYKL